MPKGHRTHPLKSGVKPIEPNSPGHWEKWRDEAPICGGSLAALEEQLIKIKSKEVRYES